MVEQTQYEEYTNARVNREYLTLNFGNAGNRIGHQYWMHISGEHGVDANGNYGGTNEEQLFNISTCYKETKTGRYIPRSILTDLEFNTLDEITGSQFGCLYAPENYIFHNDVGTSNNYARGFYTSGNWMIEKLMRATRKEVEKCDHIQLIQAVHAMGGGTGSGLTALFLQNAYDLLAGISLQTYSVYPHAGTSDIVEENYNAALCTNTLLEFTDSTVCINNKEANFRARDQVAASTKTNWKNLNEVIAMVMSNLTANFRFNGAQTTDMMSILNNLVPFPKLHMFIPSVASLVRKDALEYTNTSYLKFIIEELYNPRNRLAGNADIFDVSTPETGDVILASNCIIRGHQVSAPYVEHELFHYQLTHGHRFSSWLPNSIHSSVIQVASVGLKYSGGMMENSTAVKRIFINLSTNFKLMYDRKAFLHWYIKEGCPLNTFEETYENLTDIIATYEGFGGFNESRDKIKDEVILTRHRLSDDL